MELNTITQPDFTKLADIIWGKAKDSVLQIARNSGLYKSISISENTGSTREFSEIDLEEYAADKGESAQSERASVQQGYTKTMTTHRIARDIGISYEMRTQNKAPEVVGRLTSLGEMGPKRLDLDLSHRITFMTATSYSNLSGRTVDTSVGDDFQLAYSAHTLKGSSTTFRNLLAGNPQASKGALENMEKLVVEETYNQFGEKMTMVFDILWSADDRNTVNMISQMLKSKSDMTQGNSGVTNPQESAYRHVVLPRIATDAFGAPDTSKAKYWGIASSKHSSAYLGVWEEARLKSPDNLNAGEDFSTDDWNYGVRMGYGIVIVSAPWFKASKGNGDA